MLKAKFVSILVAFSLILSEFLPMPLYAASTSNSAPTVATGSASNVTRDSATLKADIKANGGALITEYGFCWGINSGNPEHKVIVGTSNYKGSISTSISNLSPGTKYYFYAYAKNSVGKGTGNVVSFTTQSAAASQPQTNNHDEPQNEPEKDTKAPVVSISSPSNGAVYDQGDSVSIYATASDNVGVTGMNLYLNNSSVQKSYSDSVSYTLETGNLSPGTYSIKVNAVDAPQNVGSKTVQIVIKARTAVNTPAPETGTSNPPDEPNGIKDIKAPVVSISSPSSGAVYNQGDSVSIYATASDNVGVTGMNLYVNNGSVQKSYSDSVSYTLETGSLSPGTYTIKVNAVDAPQNVGSKTVQIVIKARTSTGTQVPEANVSVPSTEPGEVKDVKAPVVSISSPSGGAVYSQGESVLIYAAASDNVGVTGMNLYVNGSTLQKSYSDSVSYTLDTSNLNPGTYTIKANAVDAAGKTGTKLIQIIIRESVADVSAEEQIAVPEDQIAVPEDQIAVPVVKEVTVQPERGYAGQKYTFTAKIDGQPQYAYIQFDDPGVGWMDKEQCRNSFRFIKTGSSDSIQPFRLERQIGTPGISPQDIRSFRVYAVNEAGESEPYEGTFVIHPNEPPGIKVLSPAEGGIYPKGMISVKAEATANAAAMNLYQILDNGAEKALLAKQVSGYVLDEKISYDKSGRYTLKITAINSEGKDSSRLVHILVGDPEPKVEGISPAKVAYGAKGQQKLELSGLNFITYSGKVDTVTFENTDDGKKFSTSIIKVEQNKVTVALPEGVTAGKYIAYVKNSRANQGIKYSGFEVSQPIKVFIAGKELSLSVSPVNESGSVLVPLRGIGEALGADVGWNGQSQEIKMTLNGSVIKLWIGNTAAEKNGQRMNLLAAPKVVNGNTMVPARFIAEAFGCKVEWDGKEGKVSISEPALPANSENADEKAFNTFYDSLVGKTFELKGPAGNSEIGLENLNAVFTRDGMEVSMLLYNIRDSKLPTHLDAVIEIYDAQGNMVDYKVADGYRLRNNFTGAIADTAVKFKEWISEDYDFFSDFRNTMNSQRTEIKATDPILVPKGGRVEIRKGSKTAIGVNVTKMALDLMNSSLWDDFTADPELLKSLIEDVYKDIAVDIAKGFVDNESFVDVIQDTLNKDKLVSLAEDTVMWCIKKSENPLWNKRMTKIMVKLTNTFGKDVMADLVKNANLAVKLTEIYERVGDAADFLSLCGNLYICIKRENQELEGKVKRGTYITELNYVYIGLKAE